MKRREEDLANQALALALDKEEKEQERARRKRIEEDEKKSEMKILEIEEIEKLAALAVPAADAKCIEGVSSQVLLKKEDKSDEEETKNPSEDRKEETVKVWKLHL